MAPDLDVSRIGTYSKKTVRFLSLMSSIVQPMKKVSGFKYGVCQNNDSNQRGSKTKQKWLRTPDLDVYIGTYCKKIAGFLSLVSHIVQHTEVNV